MSKKISELNSAALPLSGQETVVMNQNGSTVTSNLSNIQTYIKNTSFESLSVVDIKLNNSVILKGYTTNIMVGPALTSDQPGNYTMTGSNNILMGEDVGRSITTGDDNICMGKDSGNEITSGDYNILIGRDSGSNITTASNNICIGYGAGQSMTSGSNVCVGVNAGYNASGAFNTFIGHGSGANAVGVSQTVCLGYATNPLHSQCVVLGYGATTTAEKQFVLGSTDVPLLTADSGTSIGKYLVIRLNGQDLKLPLYV